jgi:hypothetical protein
MYIEAVEGFHGGAQNLAEGDARILPKFPAAAP